MLSAGFCTPLRVTLSTGLQAGKHAPPHWVSKKWQKSSIESDSTECVMSETKPYRKRRAVVQIQGLLSVSTNCSCTTQCKIISTCCSPTNVASTQSGADGGVWSAVIVLIPFDTIPLLTPPFPRSIHEHSSVCWHHWGSCCCHCGDWDHFLLLLLPGQQGEWLRDDVSTSPCSRE